MNITMNTQNSSEEAGAVDVVVMFFANMFSTFFAGALCATHNCPCRAKHTLLSHSVVTVLVWLADSVVESPEPA